MTYNEIVLSSKMNEVLIHSTTQMSGKIIVMDERGQIKEYPLLIPFRYNSKDTI